MNKKIQKIFSLFIYTVIIFLTAQSVNAATCLAPEGWPYNEVENYAKESTKTVFMGQLISKKTERQGGGYKFYELTFQVKEKDFFKGEYPNDGWIKVYSPISEELCGYHDSEYFSEGSYMTIYAQDNNGLNYTDRFGLNKKYTDELQAWRDLDSIVKASQQSVDVTKINADDNFLQRLIWYILIAGLLFLIVFYIFAKKYHEGKLLSREEDYFEDDKKMYFSTKNDEIEIRVRKNDDLS